MMHLVEHQVNLELWLDQLKIPDDITENMLEHI